MRERPPFEDVYAEYRPLIRAWSHRHFVYGMARDDVAAEIGIELWRSYEAWDPALPLLPLFSSYWRYRRMHLNRDANAQRRGRGEPQTHEDRNLVEVMVDHRSIPPAPVSPSPRRAQVWNLIALGYKGPEICEVVGIGNSGYYAMLSAWRAMGPADLGFDVTLREPAIPRCGRGHPRTIPNTYMYRGSPRCRVCHRDDAARLRYKVSA